MAEEREHIFDKPCNVRRVLRALYAGCLILIALDFFIHRHARFAAEGWWGFYGIYGFVACVVLVLLAKEMRKLVMRPEDYYDDGS